MSSRYVDGGGIGDGLSRVARALAAFVTQLAHFVCKVEIFDPISGFFMFRREIFGDAMHSLSGQGFKILLDGIASSPRLGRLTVVVTTAIAGEMLGFLWAIARIAQPTHCVVRTTSSLVFSILLCNPAVTILRI